MDRSQWQSVVTLGGSFRAPTCHNCIVYGGHLSVICDYIVESEKQRHASHKSTVATVAEQTALGNILVYRHSTYKTLLFP